MLMGPDISPRSKPVYRRARLESGEPNPIDIYIGKCVRARRNQLKWSQKKLAEKLGIGQQMVDKYEHGDNRIAASRLHDVAVALDVPIAYFFPPIPAAATGIPSQVFLPRPADGASAPDACRTPRRIAAQTGAEVAVDLWV